MLSRNIILIMETNDMVSLIKEVSFFLAIAGKIINIPDFWIWTFGRVCWQGLMSPYQGSPSSLGTMMKGLKMKQYSSSLLQQSSEAPLVGPEVGPENPGDRHVYKQPQCENRKPYRFSEVDMWSGAPFVIR
jgi:hypothetical protein